MLKLNLYFLNFIIIFHILINSTESATQTQPPTTKWECNAADEEKMDKLMLDAYILGTDQKFPTDNKSLKEFCSSRKRMLATGESYKDRCVSGPLKNTLSVFIFSLRSFLSASCKLNSKRSKAFLSAGKCFNGPTASVTACYRQVVNRLVTGRGIPNPKVKLAQLCCTYVRSIECYTSVATSGGCSEEQSSAVAGLIRAAFEDSINLLCGEYSEHTDRCDRFTFVTKSSTSGQKAHSFIMSAIQIVAEL